MLKRTLLTLLLIIQAVGGGAVSLAHARDLVTEPPHIEATHGAGCAILHDELRCALCHYASTGVITPDAFTFVAAATAVRIVPVHPARYVAAAIHLTTSARAPPTIS